MDMNTTMAVKPHKVAWKPLEMLSRPRLGPTVRSSMISIGAASEPARMRSERSRVSFGVKEPVIWKRLPNSLWIVATEMASPLPFSKRMMAIRCLTFSRVTWRMVRPPASSSSTATAGPVHLLLHRSLADAAVAPALGEDVEAEGRARAHRLLVDQPHLQRRRAPEDFLRPRHVLHARELHDDAVGALLLDHGLRDAGLVHPLVQRLDILLKRRLHDALLELGLHAAHEEQVLAVVALADDEVG